MFENCLYEKTLEGSLIEDCGVKYALKEFEENESAIRSLYLKNSNEIKLKSKLIGFNEFIEKFGKTLDEETVNYFFFNYFFLVLRVRLNFLI